MCDAILRSRAACLTLDLELRRSMIYTDPAEDVDEFAD